MPTLTIKPAADSEEQERVVPISGAEFVIGRAGGNTLIISDPGMSRVHARITPAPEGFLLKDAGSANGTFVNDRRITEHVLQDGDRIQLGNTVLVFAADVEEFLTIRAEVADLVPPSPPTPDSAAPASPPIPPAPPPSAPPPAAPPAPAAARSVPPPPQAAAPSPHQPPVPPLPASPAKVPAPPLAPVVPPPAAAVPAPPVAAAAVGQPAGFWIRVAASLIDGVIVNIAMWLLIGVVGGLLYLLTKSLVGFYLIMLPASLAALGYHLYFPATRNATPGKQFLGLRIVREDGIDPLGYGTAVLRMVGYMVSGFIMYIGFIMVAFTDGKRGLHDMIAKTRVIRIR